MTPHEIAVILSYGIEWVKYDDSEPGNPYKQGALESVAHVGACLITQRITGDSTGTCDVVDMIADFPTVPVLTRRIARYVKDVS